MERVEGKWGAYVKTMKSKLQREMTAEVIYRPTTVTKLVDPYTDLGNLLLIDTDPPPADAPDSIPNEEELLARVRDNTQYLFNKIWELERERVDEAICAKLPRPALRLPREKVLPEKRQLTKWEQEFQLPRPALRLPREKVLPEKRQLTKWEQYAQAKGIRKKKKGSKVFDETAKEWKPRYGYRRGKDSTKDWLIEIPDHKGKYTLIYMVMFMKCSYTFCVFSIFIREVINENIEISFFLSSILM
uniref:Ribosome biogenesis regulatory protein n=1 Tax=Ascaris lumbricoides TaxID=6252 RepID=A0A0M3IEU9_ASCLU